MGNICTVRARDCIPGEHGMGIVRNEKGIGNVYTVRARDIVFQVSTEKV